MIDASAAAGIDFVLTRTENAAALMAAVTGEMSGAPGVVLTGVGPGAASAVNGIAYASLERAPVLLITDGPAASLHQAIDHNALFAPITKLQGRLRGDDAGAGIETAIRTAMTPPWGPVQLDLSAQDAAAVCNRTAPRSATPETAVDEVALEQVRQRLARSRRPVLIAGLEARYGDRPKALRRLVDALDCPVLLTYKAKGVLPDGHPAYVGLFTGAVAEKDCLEQSDLIVAFGLDPVEIIPGAWSYRAPVVDLRTARGPALPAETACRVNGPLTAIAHGLLACSPSGLWTAAEIAGLRDAMRRRLALAGKGHTAQTVVETLADLAPAGTRLTVDSGAHMFSAMAGWAAEQPFGTLKSNGLSTMGFALPAAVAACLHDGALPVVAVTGDGGLMMCLSELLTAVERRCRLVVVVLNDRALSLIDIKQQRQGSERRGVGCQSVDFAIAARAFGCRAWRIEAGDALAPALSDAFAGDGPALVDVTVDPSGYAVQLEALRG